MSCYQSIRHYCFLARGASVSGPALTVPNSVADKRGGTSEASPRPQHFKNSSACYATYMAVAHGQIFKLELHSIWSKRAFCIVSPALQTARQPIDRTCSSLGRLHIAIQNAILRRRQPLQATFAHLVLPHAKLARHVRPYNMGRTYQKSDNSTGMHPPTLSRMQGSII